MLGSRSWSESEDLFEGLTGTIGCGVGCRYFLASKSSSAVPPYESVSDYVASSSVLLCALCVVYLMSQSC